MVFEDGPKMTYFTNEVTRVGLFYAHVKYKEVTMERVVQGTVFTIAGVAALLLGLSTAPMLYNAGQGMLANIIGIGGMTVASISAVAAILALAVGFKG